VVDDNAPHAGDPAHLLHSFGTTWAVASRYWKIGAGRPAPHWGRAAYDPALISCAADGHPMRQKLPAPIMEALHRSALW
jgi:hypothetical protein